MSNKGQPEFALESASDKKTVKEVIRKMSNKPAQINFETLSKQESDHLTETAKSDLKDLKKKLTSLGVKISLDFVKKVFTVMKENNTLYKYYWDSENLKNQLEVVQKLTAFYNIAKNQENAQESPLAKKRRELSKMCGYLPVSYKPNIDGLDAYLDQFSLIDLDEFSEIVIFHRLQEERARGYLRRFEDSQDTQEDTRRYIEVELTHWAQMMYNNSAALLEEKMSFDFIQRIQGQ